MCVIYSYTREQALADGELIDVSKAASEAGFRLPTAVTAAVWGQYIEVPKGLSCQDEKGRLWDILWMLHFQIRLAKSLGDEICFKLHVRNTEQKADLITLKAHCGPGDDGKPVITIMLPDED